VQTRTEKLAATAKDPGWPQRAPWAGRSPASDRKAASGALQPLRWRIPVVVRLLSFLLTASANLAIEARAVAIGFLPLVRRFLLGATPTADAALVQVATRDLAAHRRGHFEFP